MEAEQLNQASRYLLALAKHYAGAYVANGKVKAALLTGSVAEGLSDDYSDVDMIVYYDEMPSEEELQAIGRQNQITDRQLLGDPSPTAVIEIYRVHGVEIQVVHQTIAAWEQDMAVVLEQLDVKSLNQKALSGILDGIPLHGEWLIRQWQARAADYPDELAQAMVAAHLSFFPIWVVQEQVLRRDARLWLHEVFVEAEQNLLGILAGLNRLYYTPFQFKRLRRFVAKLHLTPPDLPSRLEAILQAQSRSAIAQLEQLVRETVGLVEEHMPSVDTTPVRRTLGARKAPWAPAPQVLAAVSPAKGRRADNLMPPSVEEFLVSTYPAGTEILATRSYRPGYRAYPMRVSLRTPEGSTEHCVIKTGDRIESIEREASVLEALAELGLPVPAVLAGPLVLTDPAGIGALVVLSELPGQPLPWLAIDSLAEADLTCRLLIRGVAQLHQLTEQVSRHDIASSLPHIPLSSELDEIVRRGPGWLEADPFARAVDLLRRAVPQVEVPLVFSNGDYNPLNFLHDGDALTGWIDFEGASFEDPHIGFAKFLIWSQDAHGWGTGVKAGLVERYLYAQHVSRCEFALRLALRCLTHLQRESSVNDEGALQHRHTLNLLEESLSTLKR